MAMILRLGKAVVSPRAKGKQSPMLRAKKLGPSGRTLYQNGVFVDRLVTANICSSTIGANSLRQSKRFTRAPRRSITKRRDDYNPGKQSCLPAACVSKWPSD